MKIKKYLAVTKFSIKTKLTFMTSYITSIFSFFIHILVFNALWEYILQGKMIAGYSKPELIWYITMGEFVTFSVNNSYQKVSEMIKQGDIVNLFTKPINIIYYIFFEELSALPKILVNLIFAVVLGLVMAGSLQLELLQLLLVILAVPIAITCGILLQIMIGLCAFITEENRSIYLVISKLQLLLVMTPLEFFPIVMQNIFLLLPTTYLIYVPAKLLVHFEIGQALFLMGGLLISLFILVFATMILYKKGVERINVNGG